MDINMVFTLPAEFRIKTESAKDAFAQLCLGAQDAVFEKPQDPHRHLKPLYLKGFINGKPISRMLVDGGATVNLMPLSTCKKLGKTDEDLIKTNMVLNDFTGDPTEAKGVMVTELTVGSKTLPTAFFVIEAKGNYSVLLGRDWIHANCCIPSTMHQLLVQWNGDEVEVVSADTSAHIAMASSDANWPHEEAECISGKALDDCDFICIGKSGLMPISVKPGTFDRANEVLRRWGQK